MTTAQKKKVIKVHLSPIEVHEGWLENLKKFRQVTVK
jgi:hypothetical protein